MRDEHSSPTSSLKVFLGAVGILIVFGFLSLILSGFAGHDSIEERAYQGEFDEATTQARWDNLAEVKAAQAELFDEEKVGAALADLAKAAPKPSKTDEIVPGSPTFLKQAADPPEEGDKAAPTAEAEEAQENGVKAGGNQEAAPAPEEKKEAPAPEEKKEVPAPEEKKEAPAPEEKKEAPAPEQQ